MPRPKLTSRVTVRLPEDLETDLMARAQRTRCSLNEVILCCLENELARMLTYHLDYYENLRGLMRSQPLL